MDKEEITTVATIMEGAANLPAPVKTSFLKALSNLLGGVTAIPAALMKRPAQSVEDITAARSYVAATLAKGVAEMGLNDPTVMQAAAEIYLPTTVRKVMNRMQVAQRATEHLADEASAVGDDSKAAPPGDDWMNSFMRFAEDASSEQLQHLFAGILVGEVTRPGSFALRTLRAVSELDQAVAQDFTLVWAKSVGNAVDYSIEFQRGEWFARWKRLAEAGLIAPDSTVQFLPPYMPIPNGNAFWMPMSAGGTSLVIQFSQQCQARWQHIDFTLVGRQIGSLLARPDYEANMRKPGQTLARQNGVLRVELRSAGKPVEVIGA
ncbi:hypothetical protein FHS85_001967 [Rhodoligotrophos appendicifer]|uniref:DUF2806 domain-containing protein n=1 Tax=Rhodoligotrophos appendicifer TaxID=987056 RepID=UPI001185A13E|nr:DUF2806 domain-containing protein [Rhodoligotrophos appendicifer]